MNRLTMTKRPMKLQLQAEMEIAVRGCFHFAGTVYKPSHFPSPDVSFDGTRYWQTMRFGGRMLGIRMDAAGRSRHPAVKLSVFASRQLSNGFLNTLKQEIVYRFDLGADLNHFGALCRKDPLLNPIWRRWGGMRASVGMSLYEFLVITTTLQNATVRRSVQMLDALFRNLGAPLDFDGQHLSSFWKVEALDEVSEEYLRTLKLGYRAITLKRQAIPFRNGLLDEFALRRLPSSELRGNLLSLYGVGPASVGYLMFEVFKRYDTLDYISPWEQKIYSRVLFEKDIVPQEEILSHAEQRWGSWKMLALHYVFEDLFWRRRTESLPWLEDLIRL